MRKLFFFFLVTFSLSFDLLATAIEPYLPDQGVIHGDYDAFFNPEGNYKILNARVTDRSRDNHLIKVVAENHNIRFLRLGDILYLSAKNLTKRPCKAFVRQVDLQSASLYIPNFFECMNKGPLLRIGMQVSLSATVMEERILYASQYRLILLKRKEDLLRQLNGVNQFLFNYQQEEIKTAQVFDQKIETVKKERRKALDDLASKKKDQITLQFELKKELDSIDQNITFYRIDRSEPLTDRFGSDLESELPVYSRPPTPIPLSQEQLKAHRFYDQ